MARGLQRQLAAGWEAWQVSDPKAKCKIGACSNVATTKGVCTGHRYRQVQGLSMEHPLGARPLRGRRYNRGYVVVSVPEGTPGRTKDGTMLEHRWVMQQIVKRPLLPHETVHHKNGQRDDNRPENLELWVGRHGKGASEAHCATCTCFEDHS